MNHFHAAGGIAFLVHTLLRRRPAPRGRPHHRRARPVALHHRAAPRRHRRPRRRRLGGGPEGLPRPSVLRPADDAVLRRRRPADAHRAAGPRGHQDLRGQARAPHRHRPGDGLRRPGRAARGVRRRRPRRSRPRRGDPLPGAGRQRDARAAQAHPRARRAAGPRPAGRDRHRRPDVRRVGQGAGRHPRDPRGRPRRRRSRGSATATWSPSTPSTGRLDLHVDPAELAARPATGRAPQGAEWSGTGRELFAAFRATVGTADTGASVFPGVTVPAPGGPRCPAV